MPSARNPISRKRLTELLDGMKRKRIVVVGDAMLDVYLGGDVERISPEVRDRVFEAFYTTKDVGLGTGLGLATARRIVVDRHDGSLTFDSEPGRTTFHVVLPIPPGA
jgi:nitrogen-specific signal transduction histidine kinase